MSQIMPETDAIKVASDFIMHEEKTLREHLNHIFEQDGGRRVLQNTSITIYDVSYFNGMSGHNYWKGDELIGQLYIGSLLSGTYLIYKRTYIDQVLTEKYDYYDGHGQFFYRSNTVDGQLTTYSSLNMEPHNPFFNHIYNVLHIEYEETTINYGKTERINFLEQLINSYYKDNKTNISVKDGLQDLAIQNISKEILTVESDTILKWNERQTIFKQLKKARSKILSTKRRAHNFNYLFYDLIIKIKDIALKYHTFKQRPFNNIMGTLYRWTIGNLFWFANTVRNNMGYSIAMAIYGPFTFYFITQPMNPHAMWAVGKVRNAYLEVKDSLNTQERPEVFQHNQDQDSIKTKQAATAKKNEPLKGESVSWDYRMGNFKAMQIAYEEAMVFAERMGRIEQFETQLNFPLTAEAAWMEMELYLQDINSKASFFKNLDGRVVKFLKNEKVRTLELQFYIWQKMGQFFIDYPYIVVDQDNEQTQKNYYLGRQFIFFEKMTEKLIDIGMADSLTTYKNITKLAKHFKGLKAEGRNVLDTLKKNSKIFQQKNYLSSEEHREYMRRHWEILFMQQNKKQEASSFALQSYTWSIKNALWLLQTIYSAKRSELWKHLTNYNLNHTGIAKKKSSEEMNEYLENMFNNLVMEYVSIKKEIVENLPSDHEGRLRENVIRNIKSYLIERDQLFDHSDYVMNK